MKKILLKIACDAYFGRASRIGWFSAVTGNSLSMGDFTVVKPFTLIRCDGDVKIGKYTEIASFSLIYGSANFIVGDKCYLAPQLLFNVTEDIIIGNEVEPGIWEADIPPIDSDRIIIKVCRHPGIANINHESQDGIHTLVFPIKVKEGTCCPICKGVFINGKWIRNTEKKQINA